MKLYSDRIVLQKEVIEGVLHMEDQRIVSIKRGAPPTGDVLDFKGSYIMPGVINIQNNMFLEGGVYESISKNTFRKKMSYIDRIMATVGVTTCYHDVSLERSLERGGKELLYQVLKLIRQAKQGGFSIFHQSHFKMRLGHLENMDFLKELGQENLLDFVTYRGYLKEDREHVRNAYYADYVQTRFQLSDEATLNMVERIIELRNEVSLDLFPYLNGMLATGALPTSSSRESIIRKVEELYREYIPIMLNPPTLDTMEFAKASGRFIALDVEDLIKNEDWDFSKLPLERLIITSKRQIFDFMEKIFRIAESVGMPQAAAMVTKQPAEAMKLEDRGVLEEGKIADVIVVDPRGAVPLNRLTISRGKVVFRLDFHNEKN